LIFFASDELLKFFIFGKQDKLFVGMILILIFAEALGLYGLIVAIILSQQKFSCTAATA